MEAMRYAKRTCTDQTKIDEFLNLAKTGALSMVDGEFPYVIPLNFVWHDGAIYFHGADAGRKERVLQANKNVCFLVSEEYGTITDPVPAETDTAYMSVMLFGKAERITELSQATGALQAMLDKYVPGYYEQQLSRQHVEKYRSSHGAQVAVYKITPTEVSAKVNPVNEQKMFMPGRRMQQDV
ncbi:UNVERIFIED_CONTAM: nitroimidazol reductase NimA-like FMN-containing flavoprotein (pyridoxamine 5'-phosphate oxidase superfamily) [Brevibacillus sp. OAP136]